jgi:hypothetical protein
MRVVQGVTALGTAHDVFPSIARVGKEGNLAGGLRLPPHLLSRAQTLCLLPLCSSSPPSSRFKPPCAKMASNLPASHLRSNNDLMWVRRLLGWQATEYDGRIWGRTILFVDLQHDEIVLSSSYVLAGLALPMSSFFLILLENYGLQLHHLSPHSLVLVAIFVHLCEMHVGMWPSVRLFLLFFTLRASGRCPNHLGAYYF